MEFDQIRLDKIKSDRTENLQQTNYMVYTLGRSTCEPF